MKVIHKWFCSVGSILDNAANSFSNHDALIKENISRMDVSIRKAKVSHNKLVRDIDAVDKKIEEANVNIKRWTERARKLKGEDRQTARECLARADEAQKTLEELSSQRSELESLQTKLFADIGTGEQRIAQLKRRRTACVAKQHESKARSLLDDSECAQIDDIEGIFERWEERINLDGACTTMSDPLDERFCSEEREAELDAKLDALR